MLSKKIKSIIKKSASLVLSVLLLSTNLSLVQADDLDDAISDITGTGSATGTVTIGYGGFSVESNIGYRIYVLDGNGNTVEDSVADILYQDYEAKTKMWSTQKGATTNDGKVNTTTAKDLGIPRVIKDQGNDGWTSNYEEVKADKPAENLQSCLESGELSSDLKEAMSILESKKVIDESFVGSWNKALTKSEAVDLIYKSLEASGLNSSEVVNEDVIAEEEAARLAALAEKKETAHVLIGGYSRIDLSSWNEKIEAAETEEEVDDLVSEAGEEERNAIEEEKAAAEAAAAAAKKSSGRRVIGGVITNGGGTTTSGGGTTSSGGNTSSDDRKNSIFVEGDNNRDSSGKGHGGYNIK